MLDRLTSLEEQLDRFSIVAAKLDELQANQASCLARIEELEAKVADLQTSPSAANVSRSGNDWETVRSITREEVELEARRNNVVLSGIAEVENVSCVSLDRDILPNGVLLLDAQRLGSHVDGPSNLPIGRLVGRFANCAAQSANYPGICLICKLSQPISFHNMKFSNVGRQQFEILTIVMSVNTFHGRRLPVMFVSCHNLCRISSFSTRYFGRNH